MDIITCKAGTLIRHLKTSTSYVYKGKVKCKVYGCWVEMHEYESYFREPERFCRFKWDFEGFTPLEEVL